jgi:DNA replication and repair protein RecF
MSLAELAVDDLRCIRRAEMRLHPCHNLIWGANAAGKTSVLEALFILGRGRSFRTRSSEKLIRHGADRLVVFGRTEGPPSRSLGVGVSRDGGTEARIDAAPARSLAELSSAFAVQVIEPGTHRLVEEGANRRRRWMDWAVFHVEPTFIDAWSLYTRALKQRNAALRTSPVHADVWDPELVRWGEVIAESRRRFVERLIPVWQPMVHELTDGLGVDLHYARGWNAELQLLEALQSSRERDSHRGLTHVGPHRADVVLKIRGSGLARDVLSRGQQKLVAVALTLAQLKLIRELTSEAPTLLLDDPAAELDAERLRRFVAMIAELRCQLVVTALHGNTEVFSQPDRVFHVEQGGVSQV